MKRCKVDVNTPRITARVTYHKYVDPDTGKQLLDKCQKIAVTPTALSMGEDNSVSNNIGHHYVQAYAAWKKQHPDEC